MLFVRLSVHHGDGNNQRGLMVVFKELGIVLICQSGAVQKIFNRQIEFP